MAGLEDGLILSAGSLQSVPLLDRLDSARDAGFAGVSVFAADLEPLLARGWSLASIGQRISDAGLKVADVEIVGNWLAGPSPSGRHPEWLVDLLLRSTPEALVAMAAGIGAERVSVGELFGVPFQADRMAHGFAEVCDQAAASGLDVALEFIPTGGVPDLAAGWEVVRTAGRDNGGLLLDSWHFFRSRSSLADLARLPGNAILSVQINDAPATPGVDLAREMMDRLPPGEGDLDLTGLLATLRGIGSRAPISVEVFSAALAALPPGVAARRLAEAARRVIHGRTGP